MILPEQVSRIYCDTPYVAEYRQFLSKKHCAKIVGYAKDLVFTQGTVRLQGQRQINLNERNAFTHKINQHDPDLLKNLPQKIADWLALPSTAWIENSLLVHYPSGGEFKTHTDVVVTKDSQGNVSYRVATVIVYLNDNYDGGHTVFPFMKISVKPAVGKALLFVYNYEDGVNTRTVHSGQKVDSDKYILVFFIRDREYPDELRDISVY